MMRQGHSDAIGGLLLFALSVAYHLMTLRIASSSLSDKVGPDGLPRLLALGLGVVGLALVGKGLWSLRGSAAEAPRDENAEPEATLPRALGFLSIGVGYMVVAPIVGFGPAIALVILAVALFERARPSLGMVAIAASGGLGFWLIFVKFLNVSQPLARWIG